LFLQTINGALLARRKSNGWRTKWSNKFAHCGESFTNTLQQLAAYIPTAVSMTFYGRYVIAQNQSSIQSKTTIYRKLAILQI